MKQTLKDSILKLVVYEISIIRGMQYDLEKISKKIEAYNPNFEKFELFYEDSTNNNKVLNYFSNKLLFLIKPFLNKVNFETWKQNFEQVNNREKDKKELSIAMVSNHNSNEEQKEAKEEEKVGSATFKKASNISDTQESYLLHLMIIYWILKNRSDFKSMGFNDEIH